LSHISPQPFEGANAAREVYGRQIRRFSDSLSEHGTIRWHKVNDTRWQTRFPEDLIGGVRRQNASVGGLPHNAVSHQGWRRCQVASDGREVEGRYGSHKSFHASQDHVVFSILAVVERLILQHSRQKLNVEAQKVS